MPGVLARNPALCNPRLLDCFTVTRRLLVVDGEGYGTTPANEKCYDVRGIVTITGANDLDRFPEGQFAGKTISVITPFKLRMAAEVDGKSYQADVVSWGGEDFLVSAVDDYTRYGPGWVQAICSATPNIDPPPGNQ